MRVLIVTNQLIKEENGTFYCTENVYDILKRFGQLGELRICAVKYKDRSANVIDTPLQGLIAAEHIHFIKKTYLMTSHNSFKILRECVKKSDLVIGYVPCVNATTACFFAKKYHKYFMAYVVGCVWDALWNHGILGKIIAPYNFINNKICLKCSDFGLYVTEHFLQKRYPCSGLVCGCSDVRIPEVNQDVLEKRLVTLEKISLGSAIHIATIASNSVRYKGQHYVIRALAKLKKKGNLKFHYHLIGGGDKTWLETLAKRLNVEENVHFEGIIPHNRIFEKLDEMHVYIQPSLQEGLPRSVVEAMSRGLLCVCANTAAMPEMVDAKYVVERKSVTGIAEILEHLNTDDLKEQACRNFHESKNYCEKILNAKRNCFFQKVMKACNNDV